MFYGALILFVLVMALLALSYLRPAWLRRLTPSQWIIAGGLILPLPVLIALTGTALGLGEQLLPHRSEAQPLRIAAHAERWAWTFSYPDTPGAAPTEGIVHMPAGEPVDIVVTGADVIHSFWIPRLGGKIDAIPGHTNTIRLEADEPGSYWGICAEYCGQGHDTMRFRVEAHAPEAFATTIGAAR